MAWLALLVWIGVPLFVLVMGVLLWRREKTPLGKSFVLAASIAVLFIALLVSNAVKFSPNRSVVEVRGRPDGRFVEISVRDRGAGIPAIELEHIFERFYRVAGPKTRTVGGTGLGLAIVRHVAGLHHGEVRVESQEGEGSTFVLRLPAGAPLAAPAGSGADPGSRARVG